MPAVSLLSLNRCTAIFQGTKTRTLATRTIAAAGSFLWRTRPGAGPGDHDSAIARRAERIGVTRDGRLFGRAGRALLVWCRARTSMAVVAKTVTAPGSRAMVADI